MGTFLAHCKHIICSYCQFLEAGCLVAVELRIECLHQQPVSELCAFLEDCRVGKGRIKDRDIILSSDAHLVDSMVRARVLDLNYDVGVDEVGANHVRTEWSVCFL